MIFEEADTAGLEPDARLTAMWLWTVGGGSGVGNGGSGEEGEGEEGEDEGGKTVKSTGFALEFDAARKIAQGLGVHLERATSVVEVKGETARLLPVVERTRYLFGKEADGEPAGKRSPKKKAQQTSLFDELEAAEAGVEERRFGDVSGAAPGTTVLDRVHQAMILFGAGRGEALKRFLVEEAIGQDARFWTLAQSLSALYPAGCDEKRWVDGVLARKKGLGF